MFVAEKTISFQELASADQVYKMLMAFAMFLVTIGLLYILRYNQTIALLAATIKDVKGSAAAFGIFFTVFMLAFGSLTHVVFGPRMYDFRDVWSTITRLGVRHMDMDYEETREEVGVFGAVVMCVFCVWTLIVLLNFIVTIINDSMAAMQGNDEAKPRDHEVIDYLFSIFKAKKKARVGEYFMASQ